MDPVGIFLIVMILSAIVLIAIKNYPADAVFLTMLTILFVAGIVTPSEALIGFSNEGMLTVGALYIIAAGLRETGGVLVISVKPCHPFRSKVCHSPWVDFTGSGSYVQALFFS